MFQEVSKLTEYVLSGDHPVSGLLIASFIIFQLGLLTLLLLYRFVSNRLDRAATHRNLFSEMHAIEKFLAHTSPILDKYDTRFKDVYKAVPGKAKEYLRDLQLLHSALGNRLMRTRALYSEVGRSGIADVHGFFHSSLREREDTLGNVVGREPMPDIRPTDCPDLFESMLTQMEKYDTEVSDIRKRKRA